MPIRARTTLLLDLDGTLVDPGPGIIGSYRHALTTLGVDAAGDDLRWVIGPPLRETFAHLLGLERVEEAVRLYRERYAAEGLYEAAVYPGIMEVLNKHLARGTRLLLCTAKPAVFARRVVDHFGLGPYLSAVYGPDLDGRFDDKGDLIDHLLGVEKLDPAEACMVGDRKHDVLAAARHGVPTVGVLWGYGGRDELEAAGAGLIVARPEELLPC
jgi:phosphoglycolate phosphatase